MKVNAKLRNLRIAPRKVRLVADMIRGKSLVDARDQLKFTIKKSARPVLKLLNSAAANAENNFQLNPLNFYISKITVDEGPKNKRWKPRAMGRAGAIQKKSSHITIVLDEIEGRKEKNVEKLSVKDDKKEEKKDKKSFDKKKSNKEIDNKIKKPQVRKEGSKIFRRKSM